MQACLAKFEMFNRCACLNTIRFQLMYWHYDLVPEIGNEIQRFWRNLRMDPDSPSVYLLNTESCLCLMALPKMSQIRNL